MAQVRYYYKTKSGDGWFSLKTPNFANNPDYVEISEEEWNTHLAELEALETQEPQD